MKKIKKTALCICAVVMLSGCDSLMSGSYSSTDSDDKAFSKFVDDVASGIGNKLDEASVDARLTYIGRSDAMKSYAERFRSSDISSEMKNSRFFGVIVSAISSDALSYENGADFSVQEPLNLMSYSLGNYHVKMQDMFPGIDARSIFSSWDKKMYYIYDPKKIYYMEEMDDAAVSEYDSLIISCLEMYEYLAENGRISGSGKETVFGSEMEYEDITAASETVRYYFENSHTMYTVNTVTGEYTKFTSTPKADFTVPSGYSSLSAEEWAMSAVQ